MRQPRLSRQPRLMRNVGFISGISSRYCIDLRRLVSNPELGNPLAKRARAVPKSLRNGLRRKNHIESECAGAGARLHRKPGGKAHNRGWSFLH